MITEPVEQASSVRRSGAERGQARPGVIGEGFLEEGGSFQIFIWLCQDLVAALGIFSCCMWNLVPWPRIELWPVH